MSSFTNCELLFDLKKQSHVPLHKDYVEHVSAWVSQKLFGKSILTCVEKKWLLDFSKAFKRGALRIWTQRKGSECKIREKHPDFLNNVTSVPTLEECVCEVCKPHEPTPKAGPLPKSVKKSLQRNSVKLRDEYSTDTIFHAAVNSVEDGDAKFVLRKLFESPDTLGKVLRNALESLATPPVIKRKPIEAQGF